MADSPGARYAPIVVEGVSKRYQLASDNRLLKLGRRLFPKLVPAPPELDFWALRNVGFRCEPGEALGIIGRNGAGKSTLLKVLCGVTTPTEGRVSIQGRVAPLIEVGAGFHPELTGRENVVMNAAILGMPRKEALAKYDAIVEFSGLERFMDTPVKRYSSGMTARLGFTLAVFLEPDALLVDEVLSVGDLSFVLKSYRKIEEIRKKGVPVILVSHNLQLIRNFCTRAIWLHDGQIRAQGAPAEVCAAYTRHALDTVAGELALTAGDSYRVQSDPSVSIERVRFLDRDGAEQGDHASGAEMTLEVEVASTRATDALILTVTVWQAESGQMLICQNNRDDGVTWAGASAEGRRTLRVRFPRLPFVAGLHQVSLSLSEGDITNVCDWHEKRFSFRVSGGEVGYGCFNAFPEWLPTG
jgi:ABC-type polysaccharide/polyol phosphate transport system ATPase subunit